MTRPPAPTYLGTRSLDQLDWFHRFQPVQAGQGSKELGSVVQDFVGVGLSCPVRQPANFLKFVRFGRLLLDMYLQTALEYFSLSRYEVGTHLSAFVSS